MADPNATEKRNFSPQEDISIIPKYSIPTVGMIFETEIEAYTFYNDYAWLMGFSTRKSNSSRLEHGLITMRVFVCSKQGFRVKKKGEKSPKKPRLETRTGCEAHMTIRIIPSGKFQVSEFNEDHNHECSSPSSRHRLRSHRNISQVQADEIDIADDSGVTPTIGYEFFKRRLGSKRALCFTRQDYKNHLRSKRLKIMRNGDIGALLDYFKMKQVENPSFFHTFQTDSDSFITNIFWADAKSIADYDYFGDVVCFDTTYKTNGYGRPFAPIIGVNHHKQTIVFGSALLYDERTTSFEWLFRSFFIAMSGKHPKTILTDQCDAMAKAITNVFPNTIHRLCVWHMYQNAAKHLSLYFHSHSTFAADFSKCVYDYEEEEEFLLAWNALLEKYDLKGNAWLSKQFNCKEKWALVYGRHSFCADMVSTQRSESLNSVLKKYLKSKHDLSRFFNHFDRLLEDRREQEGSADFRASQSRPSVPPLKILEAAASTYTPIIFERFKQEFDMVMAYTVQRCGDVGYVSIYHVFIEGKPKTRRVTVDQSHSTISCSCRQFEFVGIPCRHMLRVLDVLNIKELPPKYILKRWTKDAKVGMVKNHQGLTIDKDLNSTSTNRYSSLCHIYNKIFAKGAETPEGYYFLQKLSYEILGKWDSFVNCKHLQTASITITNDQEFEVRDENQTRVLHDEVDNTDGCAIQNASGIKKKNVVGGSRRLRSCLEDKRRKHNDAKAGSKLSRQANFIPHTSGLPALSTDQVLQGYLPENFHGHGIISYPMRPMQLSYDYNNHLEKQIPSCSIFPTQQLYPSGYHFGQFESTQSHMVQSAFLNLGTSQDIPDDRTLTNQGIADGANMFHSQVQ